MQDVGRSLPWGALGSFLSSVRPESALAQEMHPEIAEWSTVFKTNVILADIFDAIAQLNANMCAKGTGKPAKKPDKYPRSFRKKAKSFKKIMKVKEWMKLFEGSEKHG